MSDSKMFLMSIAIVVALSLHTWADHLTKPIQGKNAGDLSSEMMDSIGSTISAFFLSVFDKPYELAETSYDLVWNLGLPLTLCLVATSIFGYILYLLGASIFDEENTKYTYTWKVPLLLVLIYVVYLSAIKTFGLLVLNIAVAGVIIFSFVLIGSILSASGEKEQARS